MKDGKETLTDQEWLRVSLRHDVPLAPFTTLGVGGPARYFIEAPSALRLLAAVRWAEASGLPLFVLGGGSNVVIADAGFPGLVVRPALFGMSARPEGNRVIVEAGAGEPWDGFVAACVANDWAGLECLSGIPGCVGATPIQNVGAYGQEVAETLRAVEALDLASNQFVELPVEACELAYRHSRFKGRDHGRFIITRVIFELTPGGAPAVRYPELQRELAARGIDRPSLAEVRDCVLAIRRRKAMVIDESDADSRSAGSFFVNPTLDQEAFEEVCRRARALGITEAVPSFAAAGGQVKLSAAWLIERAGVARGSRYGNAGTSTKHALAIINRGGATAREIVELSCSIQQHVFDAFGVRLIPEPVFIGF